MKKKEMKDWEQNVLVAAFKVESEGYQALTELRQEMDSESYFVSAAALVKKEEGGACYMLDGFDTGAHTGNDAMIGGLIGMMVGLLAGPLGMLIGVSYGSLIGMTIDAGDAALEVCMLDQIADKMDDGMVALVALASEKTEDELDKKLSAFDTVIARFDAADVAEEVDRAYEKQSELARQARMEVRKEKEEKFKEELHENEEIFRRGFRK